MHRWKNEKQMNANKLDDFVFINVVMHEIDSTHRS